MLAVSVDSEFSHLAWLETPRKQGGLGRINYPLLADLNRKMASDYGVLMDAGHSLRGLFIIDPQGIIRHITMNDPPVSRNAAEVLRLVAAYQYTDAHGEGMAFASPVRVASIVNTAGVMRLNTCHVVCDECVFVIFRVSLDAHVARLLFLPQCAPPAGKNRVIQPSSPTRRASSPTLSPSTSKQTQKVSQRKHMNACAAELTLSGHVFAVMS